MNCDERDKLWAHYQAAKLAHALALQNLERQRGSTRQPDYARLCVDADNTERDAELARANLNHHLQQHSCGMSDPPDDSSMH